MKRLTLTVLCLMLLCLTACGGGDKPAAKKAMPSEVFGSMEEQVSFPGTMIRLGDEDLLNTFGFEAGDFEDYVYAVCEDGLLAETVVLIRVKDGTDTAPIKEKLEKYVEEQTMNYDAYLPEQAKVARQSVVAAKDGNVYLIMSSQVKELKRIAKDMLGAE